MFTPVSTRAAFAYQRVGIETSVSSADPHQLVNLLFEALLQSLAQARAAVLRKDVRTKGTEIGRAVRYLEEGLKAGLNPEQGGELATNLRSLYDYCVARLTQANAENSAEKIDEVFKLVEPVASGWKQIRTQALKGA